MFAPQLRSNSLFQTHFSDFMFHISVLRHFIVLPWAVDTVKRSARCGRPLFDCQGTRTVDHPHLDWSFGTADGPSTHLERFAWFDWLWDHMSIECQLRLVRNLTKLVFTSAFSGFGGFELLIWLLIHYVNKRLVHKLPFKNAMSAGDKCRSRRDVLASFSKEARPIHITRDQLERLPTEVHQQVKDTLPAYHDFADAKRFAYQCIRDHIYSSYAECNGRLMRCAPCDCHSHLHPRCDLWRPYSAAPDLDDDCPEDIGGHLSVHGAGLVRKGVTRFGEQKGDTDPSMPALYQWAAEQTYTCPHMIFIECGEDHDPQFVAELLPPQYHGTSVVIDATNVGDMIHRARRLTMYIDQNEVCVMGDESKINHCNASINDCR